MRELRLAQDGRIVPGAAQFALVDDDVYEWAVKSRWLVMVAGTEAARVYYAFRWPRRGEMVDCDRVLLHREIMNAPRGVNVDHRNSDGLDDRRENLRLCSQSQNNMNRRKLRGTSRYKGVSWSRANKKWQTHIKINRKSMALGHFADETDAARAYDAAAIRLFGDFARLNFPPPGQPSALMESA